MATTAKQADAEAPVHPGAGDFLNIDAHLSEEEIGVRERVRSFVEQRVKPNIKGWYDEAVFPKEIVPEFADLGLLGMHLAGYGCAGKSAVEYGLACMELEAGDSGLRTFVSVQGSLAMSAIHKFGSEDLRQKGRLRLGLERGEALDRAGHHRRRRRRLGAH
jgi:glutaryl-CoA dehydrogenase